MGAVGALTLGCDFGFGSVLVVWCCSLWLVALFLFVWLCLLDRLFSWFMSLVGWLLQIGYGLLATHNFRFGLLLLIWFVVVVDLF